MNPYGYPDCENYGREIGQQLYATFFVFAYLLPLIIIAGLSIQILIHINNCWQTNYQRSQPVHSNKRKLLASRLLIVVIVVFAIFWFPIHIHLLIAYFGELPQSNFYRTAGVLFNVMAYFNSCVNPIIYNCTCEDFRGSFKKALFCRRRSADIAGPVDEKHNRNWQSYATKKTVSVEIKCNGHSPLKVTTDEV